MSVHSTYDWLRHLADSWGLVAMAAIFLVLALWPCRRSARDANEHAANMIFRDDEHDQAH